MHRLPGSGVFVLGTMAFCIAISSDGLAQPHFELGFKAGLSLSKLSGSELKNSQSGSFDLGGGYTGQGTISSGIGDMKSEFMNGAYATMYLNQRFGVRLETLYSMKGGKDDNSGLVDIYDPTNVYVTTLSISGTNNLSLDYFEVPLLGLLTFPTGETSAFEVFAGPSFEFQTSAKTHVVVTVIAFGTSTT